MTRSRHGRTNSFQYAAREFDPGLYHYRARYYDPTAGRFLSEDQTGFGDGVDFYRYVRNDPVDSTDPTGFTTFKGFTADQEVQLRNAVDEALKKLRDTCTTGHSCAGADAPKIINYLENGTFVLNNKASWCGHTGPISYLQWRHTFSLGLSAFQKICCSLASTMVHEVVHGLSHISDKRPDQIEKDCFGCTVPETK
jgi:RHS repeat-associated protein